MKKAVSYNIGEDFISGVADFIKENFLDRGLDISKLAFVFEGKRPALFLKRALSKMMKKNFFSPTFFSIDEFIQYTLSKKTPFAKMFNMESCYTIYTLAKEIAPEIVKGRQKFSQFLPWAREISNFIDLLDFEDISQEALKNVQASANIGYEIPESINASLKNIISLRDAYHELLSEKNSFSKGFIYLSAAKAVKGVNFNEFDKILFCGFFYMQKTERTLVKHLYDTEKAILFFQGDESEWPILKDTSHEFACSIKPTKLEKNDRSLYMYTTFDRHSQVCTVREILKKIKNLDSTVIVLPDSNSMIPLVSEMGSSLGEFNVSLGYPLKRSSVYALFEFIVRAQKTRKAGEYYAKDYIAALSQPLVKNLKVLPSYSATRVLVHKVEEAILGMENTSISGNLFIKLEDVENDYALFKLASATLRAMDIDVSAEALKNILKELHLLLFTLWEDISNFHDFALSLARFLDTLLTKSFIGNYPLNLKIAKSIYSIMDEFENAPFSREDFIKEDIFKIFQNMLEDEMVAFSGSPLKGLQILGTFETRCLNFENVIIMDANEGKLPVLKLQEPLIPHDVTMGFGLDIIEKEEEIQRYLFTRIVSAAKNIHFVYEENQEKEKSRFIEGLIWQVQKEKNNIEAVSTPQVSFSVNMLPAKTEVGKNDEMIKFLKDFQYSASSIDTYIQCPLQFYYKYVLDLEEKEELMEAPGGREIGIFIHELLKEGFSRFVNRKPQIDQQFRKTFFKIFDERFTETFTRRMRSDSFLLKNVMQFRLQRFLDFEENSDEREVEEILYLEKEFKEGLKLSGNTFNFTYIVDRVEKLQDGSVLILDYKTGAGISKPQQAGSLEKMELNRESIRDRIKSFQLPLYYYFEKKKYKEIPLNAALYNLRNTNLIYFAGEKTNLERTMELCMNALDAILQEILDPERTFVADYKNESNCRVCPFFYLCR